MARNSNWGAKEGVNPHAGIFTNPPKTPEQIRVDKDPLPRDKRQRIEEIKWLKANPQDEGGDIFYPCD